MRINHKVQPLIFAINLIIIVTSVSCINRTHLANNKKREVVVYFQCSSEESSADILYSVNEIEDQLTKKNISKKINNKKKVCGYLFVNGNKRKKITRALTDIELLQEVEKFFK